MYNDWEDQFLKACHIMENTENMKLSNSAIMVMPKLAISL